jgi:hypothetical protein
MSSSPPYGDFFKDYEPAITAYEAGLFGDFEPSYVGSLEGALGFHSVVRDFILTVSRFKREGKSIKDNWQLNR